MTRRTMMQNAVKGLAVIVAGLWASVARADDAAPLTEITLYTAHNPPHSMRDAATGEYRGIGHDIVTELLRRAGVSYDIVQMPIERALAAVDEDPAACFFIMNHTPERADRFAWVKPISTGGWGVFKLKGSPITVTSVDDLKQYLIVTRNQVAVTSYVDSIGIESVKVDTTAKMLELLFVGRAQLLIYGTRDTPRLVAASGHEPLELALQLTHTEIGMGCNPAMSTDLIARLNEINAGLDDVREAAYARY
ncbi:substrate-binding periplasmic protein [Gimibacter soli]|uniref:Transporter substrate-binding domain-containing protein n=1 Tax=Gimibacter soli TaxID=3024400 RepID=A0AAE9XPK1_9PROT|nr:transporter substrate-binding domain-containing protein [Gimibacter soli]WCL54848.1 transporter substrate-binding domain-containing protein [Gimibacter soli]